MYGLKNLKKKTNPKKIILAIVVILIGGNLNSQSNEDMIKKYINNQKIRFLNELIEFASLPNDVYQKNQILENAEYLSKIMERRGISTQIIETKTGSPNVVGELKSDSSFPTILFYSHYDGVPTIRSNWSSDPFDPVLRKGILSDSNRNSYVDEMEWNEMDQDWRVFARSIADSKNAILTLLFAIDYYQANEIEIPLNLKFYFDGEEELESPGMNGFVQTHSDFLQADLMIICSGETHQSGLPTVKLGIRGILNIDLKLTTANVDLHSGHFGNFAPNAVLEMSRLLSSMKDKKGQITINGFYKDIIPFSESDKALIDDIPDVSDKLLSQFNIESPEIKGKLLQELINQPTLNIRGIKGGYVGSEARNIIPNKSEVSIDCRLVKGMDPERIFQLIIDHIKDQGFNVVLNDQSSSIKEGWNTVEIRKGGAFSASKIASDHHLSQKVIGIMKKLNSSNLVVEVTDAGSLALECFDHINVPFLSLPLSNFDCNQHTANENLAIGYFLKGIETIIHILRWE
ncbi:MAG: M20/M25/M40 family metallo-hydrolase [Fulvivirga sp.]